MMYLDNAATTFPKPRPVVDAVTKAMTSNCVNAGRGVYALAQEADKIIFETRNLVLSMLGHNKGQVIFTPSATIALNQIILGLQWNKGDCVYISPLEHNAVARVVHQLTKEFGIEVRKLPLSKELEYDLQETKDMFFRQPPKVVIMTHVSNVCGLITPIEEIAKLAKEYEATIVVDGAQAGPLLPNRGAESGVDFYVFSGHKTFYGPFGIAGFVQTRELSLKPIFFGGTGSHSELLDMPDKLPFQMEVGSPNIVAVEGLYSACKWLKETSVTKIVDHERKLMGKALKGLEELYGCRLYVNQDINKHLGVLSLTVQGYTAQEVSMILSQQYDIAVRSGLHCAPLAHEFLGTKPHGTIRVGFGYFNTEEEVERLIEALEDIVG